MSARCDIYKNIEDMREKFLRRGSGVTHVVCDGHRHYKFYPDGRESVLCRRVDGVVRLWTCPQYEENATIERADREAESAPRAVDMRFETFEGNDALRDAVRDFPGQHEKFTLILNGARRVGKTHLARALERHCLDAGRVCEFITAIDLARMFREAAPWHDNRDDRADAEDHLQRIVRAAVVIIDDLGEENTETGHFRDELKNLLDKLAGWLVITTNMPFYGDKEYSLLPPSRQAGSLNERLGDKIMARLLERCKVLVVTRSAK